MTPEEKARIIIDNQLSDAGWLVINRDEYTPNAHACAVREGLMNLHGANLEADYLLFIEGKAVGVVEAKRAENPLGEDVQVQALKYTKNLPGVGCSITIDAAVADTRERPYKIEDVKNEEGKRKFKTMYKWIDRETGTVVAQSDRNKADAKNAIKELYKTGAYRGNADLVKSKDVVEGQAVVATAEYTPSKNTKNGTWIAFGIEA